MEVTFVLILDTGLVKQLVKKESFNPNVLETIYKYPSLQSAIRGSLIEVTTPAQ